MKMTTENFIHNMEAVEHQTAEKREEFDKVVHEEYREIIIFN